MVNLLFLRFRAAARVAVFPVQLHRRSGSQTQLDMHSLSSIVPGSITEQV